MSSVWLSPDIKALRNGLAPATSAAVAAAAAAAIAGAPSERFVLRRSGARPLAFTGMLLVSQTAAIEDDAERRHAIRVYETTGHDFIVEISLFAPDGAAAAHAVAAEVDTLKDVEDFLDAYDPAGQAALTLAIDDREIDAAAVGAMAERLRAEADRLRKDFQQVRAALFAAARRDDEDFSRRVN